MTGPWWQRAVFYQIYPLTFEDSIGDLPGITQRLDHVTEILGVDAIWLNPFYATPMVDGGYDITDHCAVDPRLGTLADFDHLLAEAHRRGLRVVIDYPRTSDQHPWFLDSRSSRTAIRRDWYVWRDPRPDGVTTHVNVELPIREPVANAVRPVQSQRGLADPSGPFDR